MNDEEFDDDFDDDVFNEEYEQEQSAKFLIHMSKKVKVLINIFNSPDLDVFELRPNEPKPVEVIDSKSIMKHEVIEDLLKESLQILRDEAGMLLEKFSK